MTDMNYIVSRKLGEHMTAKAMGDRRHIILSGNKQIGFINYSPAREQYLFMPSQDTVFDEQSLYRISRFMKELEEQGSISTTLKDEKKEAPAKEPNSP